MKGACGMEEIEFDKYGIIIRIKDKKIIYVKSQTQKKEYEKNPNLPQEAYMYIRIFMDHLIVNDIQAFKEFLNAIEEEKRVFEYGKELLKSQENKLIQQREELQKQYSIMLEKLDKAIKECQL